ncbi:MAG: hemerythrin domain-containing protein [Gammaproteobacteria bacterium]|nr:hemerythrin domain-containing protein [Gammaproteobacteria bacterium]
MSALPEFHLPEPPILTRLNEDHRHLAQILEVFEDQYRAFETDEGPDYQLLRDILDYVQSFPDAIHHPTEDALFDYLLRNAALSSDEQQVVIDNRHQHGELIEMTRSLLGLIDHVFNNGIVDGAELKLTMSRYLSEQHRHMSFENDCLFPLAEARLSNRDWATLDYQLSQARDPLFDAYDEQYEILRRYIEATKPPATAAEAAQPVI